MVRSILRVETANEQHRVSTFELFFDLVFVFAFTQVTEFMVHEHTSLAVVQAMTLLTMLWWAWVSYGWLSNQTHVEQGLIRLGMTVSMVAIFIVALVIPEAYHDLPGGLSGPLVLVVGYAIVRATHLVLYLLAAGSDAGLRRQILITFVPFVVEIALLITGAIAGGALQTVLWVVAVTANGTLTYATSRTGQWRVHSAAHWGERYGLVIILAIGESIVAIGVGASERPISTPILVASALSVALAAAVWWLYFDTASTAAEHELTRTQGKNRALLALQAYTFMHLPIIAGVIISALGVETAIAHVEEPGPLGSFGTAALFGGASLYLAAHALFTARMLREWRLWRIAVAIALLPLVTLGPSISPLTTLSIALLAMVLPVIVEPLADRHLAEAGRSRATFTSPHSSSTTESGTPTVSEGGHQTFPPKPARTRATTTD